MIHVVDIIDVVGINGVVDAGFIIGSEPFIDIVHELAKLFFYFLDSLEVISALVFHGILIARLSLVHHALGFQAGVAEKEGKEQCAATCQNPVLAAHMVIL
jgi:hypothetical protein